MKLCESGVALAQDTGIRGSVLEETLDACLGGQEDEEGFLATLMDFCVRAIDVLVVDLTWEMEKILRGGL